MSPSLGLAAAAALLEGNRAATHIASWIKGHASPAQLDGYIYDTLLDEIKHAYASMVNATIRRDGEWRALSYSHQVGHGARKLAVQSLHSAVTGFTYLCTILSE